MNMSYTNPEDFTYSTCDKTLQAAVFCSVDSLLGTLILNLCSLTEDRCRESSLRDGHNAQL